MTPAPTTAALRCSDLLRLATAGMRARPTRTVLSALGIAIGIAAMISVVGITSSSQARLQAQLDALGTNLLTIEAGTTLAGGSSSLATDAVGKIGLLEGVQDVSSTATLEAKVYRSELSDPAATGGITLSAADRQLLSVTGTTIRSGSWLNDATAQYPVVVLGADAATRLGITEPGPPILIGTTYFTVVGILSHSPLAPDLDSSALIGEPVARALFAWDGSPTKIYERSAPEAVEDVRRRLAPTISPESPSQVDVSRPSDALVAQQAAGSVFTGLLIGVGSIALLVGGIGVANTMIISVMERRKEIGLRRALGATRRHITSQFMAEAVFLSLLGGLAGCLIGVLLTVLVSAVNGWPVALPPAALIVAVGGAALVGAAAGAHPAVRAARTSPVAALNST